MRDWTFFIILSAASSFMACESDGSHLPSEPPILQKCDENLCLNKNILIECQNGVEHEISCNAIEKICANGNCIDPPRETPGIPSDECHESICQNDDILRQCSNGKIQEIHCFDSDKICQNDVCTIPPTPCMQSSCKDDQMLLECRDGVEIETPCPENSVCQNASCRPLTPACSENRCKDGFTLIQCNEGIPLEIDCKTQNSICANNACIPQECTQDECRDNDPLSLYQCHEGRFVQIDCSDFGKICLNDSCAEPADEDVCHAANIAYCKEQTLISCAKDKTMERTECTVQNKICDPIAHECVYQCDENTPNSCADFKTARTCMEHAFVDTSCDSNQICSNGECIPDPCLNCTEDEFCHIFECYPKDTPIVTNVGLPCQCEGDDCYTKITNREIKSQLTSLAALAASSYLAELKNTDYLLVPNFFSKNNRGCEALVDTAPQGMAVGCLRDAFFSISQTQADFLLEKVPQILAMLGKNFQLLDKLFHVMVPKLLNKLPVYAPNGYCFYGTIDVSAQISTSDLIGLVFIANAFDREKGLLKKINVGNHKTVADVEKNARENGIPYCPDGTQFLSYTMKRTSPTLGTASANLDFCMKSCNSDDDCRPGFSCNDMPSEFPQSGLNTDNIPKKKICLDPRNIEQLKQIRDELRSAN